MNSGRDITIEFSPATATTTGFAETKIRVKPNITPAVDSKHPELAVKVKNQANILDMFPELSYDELKVLMTQHLSQQSNDSQDTTASDPTGSEPTLDSVEPHAPVVEASKDGTKDETEDVAAAFSRLFNK